MENALATTGTNALTITEKFPADQFNLLVPMKTVAEIAEIHKPVMNAVQISTNPNDKEIYLQEKPWTEQKTGIKHEAGYALTKKGLNKLMRAAGIKILNTRPVVPSTCQKCAEVNRSIGRPVNCGMCGNKDVKYEARISVPQLTGENIEIVAHKEIIVADATDGMTQKQIAEFLKFRSEMCETKAINRALRSAMLIKGTYTLQELQKPFVVAYLVPNLDNEAVKQEAVKHFFNTSQELYGGNITEQRKAVFVEEDEPEEVAYETTGQPIVEPDNRAYQQVPQLPPQQMQPTQMSGGYQQPQYQEPVYQQQPQLQQAPQQYQPPQYQQQEWGQQQAPPQQYQQATHQCSQCGAMINEKVYQYSNDKFGRPLCYNCQNARR